MRSAPLTLVVFSPVRWDVEFQRPQQLMSRLARQHRVIYVEEPVATAGVPRLERLCGVDGVVVLRPHAPFSGFDAPACVEAFGPLLRAAVAREAQGDLVSWLCTPAALPLAETVTAQLLVYDCMVAVAGDLSTLEANVLDAADLVVAAGPALWRAKRALHPNVHCVPSSSDATRFAPARVTAHFEEYLAAEKLQSHILAPRLGFMGAIDDTVDLGLIDTLATRRPDWHVVMAGPVTTARPLPERPNIHWLGDQPDPRLPAIVAAWDVCLLPYRSNAATRCLWPAQTLEYLAAEKPVVGTALPEVAAMVGAAVRSARGAQRFIDACEVALRETPEQRERRLERSAACVARFSWEEAARKVLRLLDVALEPHEELSVPRPAAAVPIAQEPAAHAA